MPVVLLAGINQAFISLGAHYDALSTDPIWTIFLATWQIAILVFGVFVGSFLLALVGGWLGGQGDAIDVRQGVAWSYVPMAATAFCWIPRLLVYGKDAFNPNKPYETFLQWLMLPLDLAIGGAMLWCIPLAVAALAEAVRVSIPRSVAVVTITALPVLVLALLQ